MTVVYAQFYFALLPLLNADANSLWGMVFFMDKEEGHRVLSGAGWACLRQASYDSLNLGDFHEYWSSFSAQPLLTSFQYLAVFHYPLPWKSPSNISVMVDEENSEQKQNLCLCSSAISRLQPKFNLKHFTSVHLGLDTHPCSSSVRQC